MSDDLGRPLRSNWDADRTQTAESYGDVPQRMGHSYFIVHDPSGIRVVEIAEGEELPVGRADDAAIVVNDVRVSRRHALLARRSGRLSVCDRGSHNATLVNGQPLRDAEALLVPGDVITIGAAQIVVVALAESSKSEGHAGRLEQEIARLGSDPAARAVVVRVAFDWSRREAVLKDSAALLETTNLVEERQPGEYAVLLVGVSDPRGTVEALRRAAPGAQVSSARFPDDGTTAESLWVACLGKTAPARPADLPPDVVAADPVMLDLLRRIRRVANAPTTVLVYGETGVGKEIVAEHIHRLSARCQRPFLHLNCASLPETLLESELFGHEKGAFTGALARKMGYFEAADGGTLFFDEIGEMPLVVQAKLLRVLETRMVTPLGSTRPRAVDVRLICATHRDLEAEVRAGRFRQDLFYRLNGVMLQVPPLRERRSEIVLLVELFAKRFATAMGAAPLTFGGQALAALARYPWPGNVRELRNVVENTVLMAEGTNHVQLEHLPAAVRGHMATPRPPEDGLQALSQGLSAGLSQGPIRESLNDLERQSIEAALNAERGNVTRTAMRLGISRGSLLYKLKKYSIRPPSS